MAKVKMDLDGIIKMIGDVAQFGENYLTREKSYEGEYTDLLRFKNLVKMATIHIERREEELIHEGAENFRIK